MSMNWETQSADARAARKAVKCPQKRNINLNMREVHSPGSLKLVAGILCILVLVGGVVKFGVYDQMAQLREAERAYHQVHQQYEQAHRELADYDRVLSEYRAYSRDWMNDADAENAVSVERRAVLDLIEDEMMSRGTVLETHVQGTSVNVVMNNMRLEKIAEMLDAVRASDIVASADLVVAKTDHVPPSYVLKFSVDITLREEAAE